MNPAVLRAHCPHDLRLVLDLGGDERNGHEHNHGSLVVSLWGYPCEVPPHDTVHATNPRQYVLVNFLVNLLFIRNAGRSQLVSPRHIVCCSFFRTHGYHGAVSPSRADPSQAGGHTFSAAPARGTGALNTGRGAPLVVPLECLVLGVLPVSVLPIVVTPLGAVACSTFWGACLGRSWRGLGGARVDSTRS